MLGAGLSGAELEVLPFFRDLRGEPYFLVLPLESACSPRLLVPSFICQPSNSELTSSTAFFHF